MSQKWRFDPKWRIKIWFFVITLRGSNIFSIFYLHSFGISKMQILWKKSFSKNPRWRLKRFFYSSRHLGFFEKLFFHKICVLQRPNECKKMIEKMMDSLRVTSKNLILIRHFGSNRHFWLIWQDMLLIHVADINKNALYKTERKNTWKFLSYATLHFGRHIGQQTPSWIWQKKIFCEICPTKIQAQII
jgi:hypothetical protein